MNDQAIETVQCDCCERLVPVEEIAFISWDRCGMDTWVCLQCQEETEAAYGIRRREEKGAR